MQSQKQWTEHAAFMDQLAAGCICVGGPIGDSGDALLIVDAPNEDEIRDTLSRDPWSQQGFLNIRQIQRWTVLLESKR
jgi:uncharacterized protein YciI